MVLIIPFEHIFLKKSGKDIDDLKKKSCCKINNRHNDYFIINCYFFSVLGATLTIIAISIALPLYWGEKD